MNKLFYFLIVGLSLIAFQVVEVEAQRGDPGVSRDTRDMGRPPARDTRDMGRPPARDTRDMGRPPARDPRGPANPPVRRGDGRVTDAERDARYRDGGAPARDTRDMGRPPARDPRRAPVDTRVREDTRTPARDTRGAASSVDKRGGGLSKKEMVEACKKQYGKKKKNKAAKQACIKAAKGK